MTDEIDRAQIAEQYAQSDRDQAYKIPARGLSAVGFCHNCGDPIAPGLMFCPDGPECRDDYEKRQRARQREGG